MAALISGQPNLDLSCFQTRVSEAPGRGRMLVADADLEPGHVVLRNAPFARVLHPALWSQRCYTCMSVLGESGIRSGAVWYCCERCQQIDYLCDHQVEGPLLEKLRSSVESGDILSDMLLVARTFRRIHAGTNSNIYTLSSGKDASEVIHSSANHVMDLVFHEPMDKSPVFEVSRNVINSGLLGPIAEVLVSELDVANMLLRFGCNNFAVTSNLLVSIGAAVCPAGAVLNHSCSPTCAVTWNPITGAQEIRCVRAVEKGTELTHSYSDSAMPTDIRQGKLRREYGFLCNCARCATPTLITLAPAFRMELLQSCRKLSSLHEKRNNLASKGDEKEIANMVSFRAEVEKLASDSNYKWNLDNCMQGNLLGEHILTDGKSPTFTSMGTTSHLNAASDATNSTNYRQVSEECVAQLEIARQLLHEASACTDDSTMQLAKLQEANTIYSQWLHPLHADRLKLCNEMLTLSLAAGDYGSAVGHVRRAVAIYDHVYGNEYAHPMVGLQSYTMGNLYFEVKRYKEAIACLERSVQILRVTHGYDSELVEGLASLLSQAKQTYAMTKMMQYPESGGPSVKKKKRKSKKKGKKGRSR